MVANAKPAATAKKTVKAAAKKSVVKGAKTAKTATIAEDSAKKKAEVKSLKAAAPEKVVPAADSAPKPEAGKTRYSDADLQMFKENILQKLAKAKDDYNMLRQAMTHGASNGDEDTSPTFKPIEDGDVATSKEDLGQLAQRQYKFIHSLEAALVRIENKTYGISRVSGKLIPKERLMLVPHATLSVEDKNNR